MAKEVAPKDGTVTVRTPFDRFVQYALERAVVDESFNATDDLVEAQVNRILEADNLESLFEAMQLSGLQGFKDLDNGTELKVTDYRYVKSNRQDLAGALWNPDRNEGAFVIVNAVDLATGDEIALNTSVIRLVSFFRMCETMGFFPVEVRVVKETTSNGYETITLAKIRKQAVKSETA